MIWNNTIQASRFLDSISRNDNSGVDLTESAPSVTITRDKDQQASEINRGLEDFGRMIGRDLAMVDENGTVDIVDQVKSTGNPFLNESLERLIANNLIEIKLLPARDEVGNFLEDREQKLALEPYIELSPKIFEDKDQGNLETLKFLAGLTKETGIEQFLLPDFTTKVNNNNGTGNILVHGGYKVLKFLDEKLDKFTLYDVLDSKTDLRDKLEFFIDYSKAGIEVRFNGDTDYRVVGDYPAKSQLNEWSDDQVEEMYETLTKLVGGDPKKIFAVGATQRNTRDLSINDISLANPSDIFDKFLDNNLPIDQQRAVYEADWFWDPAHKDGPRLILNGSEVNSIDKRRMIKSLAEENLLHTGIKIVDFDSNDSSHLAAENRSQQTIKLRIA